MAQNPQAELISRIWYDAAQQDPKSLLHRHKGGAGEGGKHPKRTDEQPAGEHKHAGLCKLANRGLALEVLYEQEVATHRAGLHEAEQTKAHGEHNQVEEGDFGHGRWAGTLNPPLSITSAKRSSLATCGL